jgi:ssDNA-binding Zn-finger/Zn-ribbon topoisomerase 1
MTTGIQTAPAPWCPDCGAKMVLKRPGKYQDWEPFWGCSEYKYGCRGTRQIGPDGKPIIEEERQPFTVEDFDQ